MIIYFIIFIILNTMLITGCQTLTPSFEFKSVQSESFKSESLIPSLSTVSTINTTRKALIIGNANYPVSRLFGDKPLTNPRNDALDIANRLTQYQFNVTTVLDANSSKMKAAIKKFTTQLHPNDIAMIYYSGHGTAYTCNQDEVQKNYIIPVGEVINDHEDLCQYAIAAESLIDKLTQRGTGTNILILDSCRKSLEAIEFKGFEHQGFTGMYGGSGTFIGYATAPGKLSLGNSSRRNSLYTESLLKVLQPPYDNQPIESLFQQVRTLVVQEANKLKQKQVPWDANGLETSFCFRSPCGGNTHQLIATTIQPVVQPIPLVHSITSVPEPVKKIKYKQEPKVTVKDSLLPKMVHIPTGCFQMGSLEFATDSSDNEQQNLVCLNEFYIGKHEVTNDEFRRLHPYHNSGEFAGRSLNQDNQPVVNVTWHDAMVYAKWLSKQTGASFRLPTEAEWEYVARAEIVDMHDNVLEWTCSSYSEDYDNTEQNCNELSLSDDDTRVVRGGGDFSYRDNWVVSTGENQLGFRLVQDIIDKQEE